MNERTHRINRHPERARTSRAELDPVLDAGHHVGTLCTVVDGRPWVVPMLYARDGDRLLLHGSTGAGALRRVSSGAPAALCVTHVDGWVFAHSMFNASANYRSAVVHGQIVDLPADETAQALTTMVDLITPGRSAETPPHTRKQLAATKVMAMPIVDGQWTVKIRNGGPTAPEDGEEYDPSLWTGVLPIRSAYGEPVTTAGWSADIPVSESVRRMIERGDEPDDGRH